VAYQANDRGGKIRGVLAARTGASTIPQIYIGGTHIGGCTELFDACMDGTLRSRLGEAGVSIDGQVSIDAYGLLPRWLHPREMA
jgi:cysteine synthase A